MKTTIISEIEEGFYTYEEGSFGTLICKYDKGCCLIYYQKRENGMEVYLDPPYKENFSLHNLKSTIQDKKIKVTGYSTKEDLVADHPEHFFR